MNYKRQRTNIESFKITNIGKERNKSYRISFMLCIGLKDYDEQGK